jgi:hypothetical protein
MPYDMKPTPGFYHWEIYTKISTDSQQKTSIMDVSVVVGAKTNIAISKLEIQSAVDTCDES